MQVVIPDERELGGISASPVAAVSVHALGKRFGEQWAVRDVDLTIAKEDFFSIIGPSGCGKTTTLRLLAGLERPTTGEIWVGGKDVTAVPAYRRPVNTVFQHYALFPHLSVFENIAFGLRERKTNKAEVNKLVRSAMELVQLAERASARPKELSGGQQQRVALARALVLEPEVLVFDEPLGALDLKLRREMQAALREVQQRIGRAFIYVTHDQEEAFSMSDRVAVMDHGHVVQIAPPREVYDRPQSLYVARFVGASNALEATVRGLGADGYVVDVKGIGTVPCHGVAGLESGERITVIARPEAAAVATGAEELCVSGVVRDVAFVGPQTNYLFEVRDVGTVHVQASAAGLPGEPQVGDEIRIGWPLSRLWAVPAE
ncbi:MAG: ABC transporter ATP-binding protein [Solirubrobacteraceae bacterium]